MDEDEDMTHRPLVVLQSFPAPRETTNPYIVMLAESLASHPGVELRAFTWRDALFSRYDVFHAHWPEVHVTGRTRLRTAVFQLLFAALLLRLRLLRTPLVRTLHNLHCPRAFHAERSSSFAGPSGGPPCGSGSTGRPPCRGGGRSRRFRTATTATGSLASRGRPRYRGGSSSPVWCAGTRTPPA